MTLHRVRGCGPGFDEQALPAFAGRVLAVGLSVARRCAALQVPDPHAESGALIAAAALVHGLTVATRNTADVALPAWRFSTSGSPEK